MSTFRGLVVLLSLLLTSCAKQDAPARRAPATRPTAVGSIRGQSLFIGTPPVPRPIDNHICPGAKPIVDESILVQKTGDIQNVVVYLRDCPITTIPTTQPIIDQHDCRYEPHVLAIQSGQKVVFKSSEPPSVAHNVHIAALGINQSITGSGSLPPVSFPSADFVNVRCDVHPWMSCWIAVMDTACFAVTDEQGRYQINNIPVGTYTLVAWHERLPPIEQQIEVKANAVTEVPLKFESP